MPWRDFQQATKFGVVLGLGARPGITPPSVEELRWGDDEIADMFDAPAMPE